MSHQNLPGICTAARAADGVGACRGTSIAQVASDQQLNSCKMKPANRDGGYARLMKGVDRDRFALVSWKPDRLATARPPNTLKRKETWTRDRHATWKMLAFVRGVQ